LAANDATKMYVTNTAACSSGGSWQTFQTSLPWTLGQTNAVTRVYVKFKNASGAESACISDSITHDNTVPAAPESFDDGTTTGSSTSSPQLTWQESSDSGAGISHYEVAVGNGGSITAIKDWYSVGKVTTTTVSDLTLVEGQTYYTSIR